MRTRIAFVSLAVVALVFGGCGGGKKKSATVKPRTYKVKVTGANEVPKGAPNGSGTAVVSIRASSNIVCWKFTNLKNVTAPKAAHIHQAPAGKAGSIVIPFGGVYKASGCTPKVAPRLLTQIEANPKGFYVNVHNAAFPGGAVRSQL